MGGPKRTIHVRVEGRVQGVGFRAFVSNNARALSLSGWVRNRMDGSVEAVFQGDTGAAAVMLERCHSGPPSAAVERVEILGDGVSSVAFNGFEVRPTG